MKLIVRSGGILECGDKAYRCVLGKGGLGHKEKEGDGITPIGTYPLRALYYRPDRLNRPRTGLPVQALSKDDGWCDEPTHPSYNQFIAKPFPVGHEDMWREDGIYDLVVVIGYNDDPVIPGKGSAIFLHVAKPNYEPTEGCIAMSRTDLLEVLAACDLEAEIEIG